MLREFIDDFRKFLRDPQQVVDEPQSRPLWTWLIVLAIDIVIALGIIYPLVYLIDTGNDQATEFRSTAVLHTPYP